MIAETSGCNEEQGRPPKSQGHTEDYGSIPWLISPNTVERWGNGPMTWKYCKRYMCLMRTDNRSRSMKADAEAEASVVSQSRQGLVDDCSSGDDGKARARRGKGR